MTIHMLKRLCQYVLILLLDYIILTGWDCALFEIKQRDGGRAFGGTRETRSARGYFFVRKSNQNEPKGLRPLWNPRGRVPAKVVLY